ncbi:hypothetical protein N9K38_00530 [Flavobacteriales bacterium]|nr:hypothetical protein [Flavobacteriales bacterium]
MNKLILLLITLTILTNVSYASFPVSDTLKMKQDTVQTEAVEQYHLRMQKMGIDLNSCKCESCRDDITPSITSINNREVNLLNPFKRIWLPIIITITLLSAIVVILLFRWSNSANLPG